MNTEHTEHLPWVRLDPPSVVSVCLYHTCPLSVLSYVSSSFIHRLLTLILQPPLINSSVCVDNTVFLHVSALFWVTVVYVLLFNCLRLWKHYYTLGNFIFSLIDQMIIGKPNCSSSIVIKIIQSWVIFFQINKSLVTESSFPHSSSTVSYRFEDFKKLLLIPKRQIWQNKPDKLKHSRGNTTSILEIFFHRTVGTLR